MLGETISHYRITKQLGAGGMGVVYEAVDTKLDRTVALKFLPPESTRDPQAKTRFIREAKAAAGLSHPNIATIYEIDEADGQLFIAMECVEGQSLRERIATGPLPIPEVLDLGKQIAAGLQEAHDKGIVHRDIKPANIMVTPNGVAKILDFGLAWSPDATQLTKTGTTVGTIAYLSPEQASAAKVDHRADIWAMGSVLHEMVVGRPPFAGEHQQAILHAVLNDDPEPLTGLRTGVPLELERIVGKALRKDPGLRYQSARGLSADLEALAFTDPGSLSDTRKLASPRKGPSWGAAVLGVAGAVVLIVVGVFAVKLLSPRTQPDIEVTERKLAVLVFRNLGAEGHLQYLAAGVSEDLNVSLHGVPGLSVLPRGAVEQFRDKVTNPREVGQVLDCDYVLDGSVRLAGESLKLTATLADAHSGTQVWARSYEAPTEEIFALQDSIQNQVATALNLADAEAWDGIVSRQWTQNVEAYSYYLAAREIAIRDWTDPRTPSLEKQWLDQALALDPFYAPALTELAWVYLNRGQVDGVFPPDRYEQARQLIHSAKEIDPQLAIAWLSEAALLETIDPEASLARTRRAIELNPALPEAYTHLGRVLYFGGRIDEALAAWDMVARVDPYDGSGLYSAAAVLSGTGDLTRAQEFVDEGLSALPDYADLRYAQAYIWQQAGDTDAAIAEYRQNIATNPGHFESYHWLADLYQREGCHAEADSLYLVIATRWPEYPLPLTLAGAHFMRREQYERAEGFFRQAIQSEKYGLHARVNLAWCLSEQERAEEAQAEITEVERIWPEDHEAAERLGWYYRWHGKDLEAAEQWYLRGLASVPRNTWLLRQLAYFYTSQGRYSEAVEMLNRSLAVNPRDWDTLVQLTNTQLAAGEMGAAIIAAETAVDVRPLHPRGWSVLGEALRESGRRHEAAAALLKAIELGSGSDKRGALINLGRIYREEGRFRRAIDMYKQAAAIQQGQSGWAWIQVTIVAWLLLSDAEEARLACEELLHPDLSKIHHAYGLMTLADVAAASGFLAESDSLYAEAEPLIEAELERQPGWSFVPWTAATFHARRGNEEHARELLDDLIANYGDIASWQKSIASVFAVLGDHDAALAHLENMFELGWDTTAVIEADRDLRELRKDPRFAELIAKHQ